jgi:hypothetical protein
MIRSARSFAAVAVMAVLVGACSAPEPESRASLSWDHLPEAPAWRQATKAALRTDGAALLAAEPRDVARYCPVYPEADDSARADFWTGMIAAVAKYESSWNPRALGPGRRYHGLMQISPATARGAGCDPDRLLDGAENLGCAVRIAARRAAASEVADVMRDWGPMQKRDVQRSIAAHLRDEPYCTG